MNQIIRKSIRPQTYIGVGVHDGLSALLATKHKFDFLWIGSFSGSASLGIPDNALRDPSEIVSLVSSIARVTDQPLIVDLEWGYGDTLKVERVVDQIIRAGAKGICLEDSSLSKRSSLYDIEERMLATREEHSLRLEAALRVIRRFPSNTCQLIARTEALVAGFGVEEAIQRAEAYVALGADMVFAQSKDKSGGELLEFLAQWQRRTPVMLAPTCVSEISIGGLYSAGATHVIFANHALRSAYRAMDDTLRLLHETREQNSVEGKIARIDEIASLTGALDGGVSPIRSEYSERRIVGE